MHCPDCGFPPELCQCGEADGYAAGVDQLAEHVERGLRFGLPGNVPPTAQQVTGQLGDSQAIATNGQRFDAVIASTVKGRPIPWSVTLAAPNRARGDNSLAVDYNQSFATVEYGAGGGATQVQIDVGQGCTFSVFGDYLKVTIIADLSIVVAGAPQLRLGAFATPGVARSTGPVFRTVQYSTLTTGTNESRFVPPFAAIAYPQLNASGGQHDGELEFENTAFTNQIHQAFMSNNAANTEFASVMLGLRVPAGATSLRLRNTGPATWNAPMVRYQLAI